MRLLNRSRREAFVHSTRLVGHSRMVAARLELTELYGISRQRLVMSCGLMFWIVPESSANKKLTKRSVSSGWPSLDQKFHLRALS